MPRIFLIALIATAVAFPSQAATVFSNLLQSQNYEVGSGQWWDDARILGGGRLKRFRFHGSNGSANSPSTIGANVALHVFDEANGRPNGALLGSFRVESSVRYRTGESGIIESSDLEPRSIWLPSNARLGVSITMASSFFIRMYDPPTVGASENIFWMSNPPFPQTITNRVANLGFEIETGWEGDFNFDDAVNAVDLSMWRTTFGPLGAADGDGDRDSDGADLLIWQRQFGATAANAPAVVPEPNSVILALAAFLLAGAYRRRL